MNYEAVELEIVSRLEASTNLSAIADIDCTQKFRQN